MVPAKKNPGTVVLSHHGVCAGQPARPDRRDAELGQVLERTDEPRGGDDLVDLEREVAAAVGPPEVHRQGAVAARHGLDALDRGVEDGHAAAEHVVLVRLDVPGADADQRAGVDRQARGRRRREHQLARPRQKAVGELEPGVLLADDEDALPGVALGFLDVRVVTRVLHAGAGWDVGLGHADGDDERLGAIVPSEVSTTNRRPSGPSSSVSRSSGSRSGPRWRRARRRP